MTEVHVAAGVAVVVLNLIAGAWGGYSWLAERPSAGFWYALRSAQVAVVVQAALGGILVLLGREAAEGLHYVYGLLPLLVSFLAEGARTAAAVQILGDTDFEALPEERQRSVALAILRRETGIMAVSAGVIFFLSLRAAFTSPSF